MEDVFNIKDSTTARAFLQEKRGNDDGLLRPKLEEGKDGKRELVIRFLPNLTPKGTLGSTVIEKHIHYADFKSNPEIQGYYDCLKNTSIGKDCPLCKTFWLLKNSNNATEQEKAKLISRSTRFYAYVLVVEDTQVPENEGKIFIFPFGHKIYKKIKAKSDSVRKPIIVEDLVYGANLNLVIEEVGGFYNYDSSEFEAPEPITIDGKAIKADADGNVSDKDRARVVEFLKSRTHNLEDLSAKDWTPEQVDKVDNIIAVLSGAPMTGSSNQFVPAAKSAPISSASVFSDDDDDDDDDAIEVTPEVESVKEEKVSKPIVAERTVSDVKKKANLFFEDED